MIRSVPNSKVSKWSWQRSGLRVGSRTTLPPRSPGRFTSVFGMGTGPSSQLWPPTPLNPGLRNLLDKSSRRRQLIKSIGKRRLRWSGWTVRSRLVPSSDRDSDKDEEYEDCDRGKQEKR